MINIKKEIEEFLVTKDNFKDISDRSEADFQFELGYFLKSIKSYKNLHFEYQFKGLYSSNKTILKKEADLCVLTDNNDSVDVCIEIKLLKKNSGHTNLFASCFEDICYLSQLKKIGKIKHGYFVLICADTSIIQKKNGRGGLFWKGFNFEDPDNCRLEDLSKYKLDDLPNKKKKPKLKEFLKYNTLERLEGKCVVYKQPFKNLNYAYCLIEVD